MLRLPYGVKDVFKGWLDEHIPGEAAKILGRVKEVRGGKLNDSRFGNRMRGEGEIADQVAQMFNVIRTREGLRIPSELSAASFRNPAGEQLGLFQPPYGKAVRCKKFQNRISFLCCCGIGNL